MRTSILMIGVSLLSFGLVSACSNRKQEAPKVTVAKKPVAPAVPRDLPNILVFSIDTLRADHLGSYGYTTDTSPNIDAFAKEAALFEHAVSQAPSTTPSHMSLFTGVTPAVHRVAGIGPEMKDPPLSLSLEKSIVTFPEMLKKQGYLTAGLHGGGMMAPVFGFFRGFDLYSSSLISFNWHRAYKDPSDLKPIEDILSLARKRKQPLFLFLHHYVCHVPYISAPDDLRFRFLNPKVPGLPTGIDDARKARFFDALGKTPASKDVFTALRKAKDLITKNFWSQVDLSRPDHRRHIVALYDSGILYADLLFGRVMDILKRTGDYENTIIVLTSDHGEEFFEHGGKMHWNLFIEALHVPMIIRFPRKLGDISKPARIQADVRNMDLFPTLFEILGLPLERPVQGESFLPLLVKRDRTYHPRMLSYDPYLKGVRFIDDGWIYSNQSSHNIPEWLFDRSGDPAEKNNLASQKPDVMKAMQETAGRIGEDDRRFREKLTALPGFEPPPADPTVDGDLNAFGLSEPGGEAAAQDPDKVDETLVEQLRALGYIQE